MKSAIQEKNSWLKSIARLNSKQRAQVVRSLTEKEVEAVLYDWESWGRDNQLEPPGLWRVWLILAGRGWGKNRTIGEYCIKHVRAGDYGRVGLIAPTAADVRDTVVEGESGIMAISPPSFRPLYEPSKRRLTWPNGAVGTTFSADEPERLRGPQHDLVIADELGAWRYPQECWDMAMFGLRLGKDPRAVIGTTPKPIKTLKQIMESPTTVITRGTSYENRDNLADAFYSEIVNRFEGTRLGRQELYAEVLDDNPDALWKREWIDNNRVTNHPDLIRVAVGVDPEAQSHEESAETGIVAAGVALVKGVLHGYVLDDMSLRGTPDRWGKTAVTAYHKHMADLIIGEVNNGGEMVEYVIRSIAESDRAGIVPFKAVHASRGKATRAEPVSALYEQGRIHHVGMFSNLEDQLCDWVPGGKSPDRLDALVWALTELMLEQPAPRDEIVIYDSMKLVDIAI